MSETVSCTEQEHTINRDDYLEGKIDHQAFYLAVAEVIGLKPLEKIVLRIAPLETIRQALDGEDWHLNTILLGKWDGMDSAVRSLVAARAKEVMLVSGTYSWSLAETVCVLKAVARMMVERATKT